MLLEILAKIGITLAVMIPTLSVTYTTLVALIWWETKTNNYWEETLNQKRNAFYEAFDACEAARRKVTSTN